MLTFINTLLAFIIGAFAGKLIYLTTRLLPPILLEEKEGEPRDILRRFFRRPRCNACSISRSWAEGLPLIGDFLLGGGCPECGKRADLSKRVFEWGMAIFFAGAALLLPMGIPLCFALLMSSLLIACFKTDYDYGVLPDQLTQAIVWVALIGSLYPVLVPPGEAILGAVFGYGFLFFFNELYRYFRGTDGMFPGDFKLNAGIGACVGVKPLLSVMVISFFLLLVFTFIFHIFRKKRPDLTFLHEEAPYGCYASIVGIVFILFG